MAGDRKAQQRAQESSIQAQMAQNVIIEQAAKLKAKELKDAEQAQRIMMRALRSGGTGYFSAVPNNPILGGSGSEVLG